MTRGEKSTTVFGTLAVYLLKNKFLLLTKIHICMYDFVKSRVCVSLGKSIKLKCEVIENHGCNKN